MSLQVLPEGHRDVWRRGTRDATSGCLSAGGTQSQDRAASLVTNRLFHADQRRARPSQCAAHGGGGLSTGY